MFTLDTRGFGETEPAHFGTLYCGPGSIREHFKQHTIRVLPKHHQFSQGKMTLTSVKNLGDAGFVFKIDRITNSFLCCP